MAGIIGLITSLFVSCVILSSAKESCTPEEISLENFQKLALANNDLAFNLHRKLTTQNSDNVFFSPFSISSAFGMLLHGARTETAEELRNVLGYEKADLSEDRVANTFQRFLSEVLKSGDPSNAYVLNSANAILADRHLNLLPEYKSDVKELYEASVQEVDFAKDAARVVNEINSWVKEKTNGKIDKLLDELSPSTIMVLLNAVYFKGTWKTEFNPDYTMEENFYNNGLESSAKKVPMMHMTSHFPYANMGDFQALELPYKGDNISMLVLLPDERDGLAALEESMNPEKLVKVQQNLYKTKVEITLPKFKLQFFKDLSSDFEALGAEKIFDAGEADFSGMTSSKSVFVSQVLHKAVVEVNEEGSEAAAVTGIVSNRMRPIVETPEFKADHPFLFAIVEKGSQSNLILFLGRVNNL